MATMTRKTASYWGIYMKRSKVRWSIIYIAITLPRTMLYCKVTYWTYMSFAQILKKLIQAVSVRKGKCAWDKKSKWYKKKMKRRKMLESSRKTGEQEALEKRKKIQQCNRCIVTRN